MPRVSPVSDSIPRSVQEVLERQAQRYGSPLFNHLVLARCPQVFAGFRAMWDGIEAAALLPEALLSLVNIRVATLIGCGL